MENLIILAILAVIFGGAAGYIYKARKKGQKCIGCPNGGCCSAQDQQSCGCGCIKG